MILLKSKIGELLMERGLKGKWLAQQLNISQNQMSNYVTGKSFPPVDKAFEISILLNCRVDDLYEVHKENPAN